MIGSSEPGLPCARGRYCPAGVEQEVLCPPGTFTPHQGAISEVIFCVTTAVQCLFLHALFYVWVDFSATCNTYEAQSFLRNCCFGTSFQTLCSFPQSCDGIIAVYPGKAQWSYKNDSQFCNIWMKNGLFI